MPILNHRNACIYYEETGSGEPVILLHGFSVNTAYWSQTGVTAKLAEHYRVIAMDLRGHGRTFVEGEPKAFDAATIGDDIEVLADRLAIERFHLVGHSTGGMVAVRYGLENRERLASLILIGTSSATVLGSGHPEIRRQALEIFARIYENHSWDQIFAHIRQLPGPLLYHLNQYPDRDRLWQSVENICRLGDPDTLAAFARSFYSDPDPRLEGLRRISCPTLILVGEHDKLFLKPSELMAQAIPQAKYVILKGVGHMTAIEAPKRTADEILTFLECLSDGGG